MGSWTPVACFSARCFESEQEAIAAARAAVPWLTGVLGPAG